MADNHCDAFHYRLLNRLQQDCEYYLGFGARHKKHLWAQDEAEQIQKMKELYAALPEKPEWITLADIERYEVAMVGHVGSTNARRVSLPATDGPQGEIMKIRKMEEVFEGKAEGLCCGLPYQTELVSSDGVSIVFWCGDSFDAELLQKAIHKARNNLDVVCAAASLGQPTGYWAREEMR